MRSVALQGLVQPSIVQSTEKGRHLCSERPRLRALLMGVDRLLIRPYFDRREMVRPILLVNDVEPQVARLLAALINMGPHEAHRLVSTGSGDIDMRHGVYGATLLA